MPLSDGAAFDTLSSVYYLRTLALDADSSPAERLLGAKHALRLEIQVQDAGDHHDAGRQIPNDPCRARRARART